MGGAGGQAAPRTHKNGKEVKKWEGKQGEEESKKEEGEGRREKRREKKKRERKKRRKRGKKRGELYEKEKYIRKK